MIARTMFFALVATSAASLGCSSLTKPNEITIQAEVPTAQKPSAPAPAPPTVPSIAQQRKPPTPPAH